MVILNIDALEISTFRSSIDIQLLTGTLPKRPVPPFINTDKSLIGSSLKIVLLWEKQLEYLFGLYIPNKIGDILV